VSVVGACLLAVFGFVGWIAYRTNQVEKRMAQLVGLVGSIRLRLFEQEVRQLSADGLFVHGDLAKTMASMVLALLSEKDIKSLEEDHERNAPNVPFHRYILYNYSFRTTPSKRFEVDQPSPAAIILHERARAIESLERISSSLDNGLERVLSQLAAAIEEEDTKGDGQLDSKGDTPNP